MEMELTWPRLVFVGDSLTEQGFSSESGWLAQVADRTQRRCDVIGRGFSGYNSRWWRALAPAVLSDRLLSSCALCAVFLGCNDSSRSCQPGRDLHVPAAEFSDNMLAIVRHIMSKGLSSRQLLIINVPPVDEAACAADSARLGVPFFKGLTDCQLYNQELLLVAKETGVELVDVYTAFTKREDWRQLLSCDGVHLSHSGSSLLFNCLWPRVSERIDQLPILLPDYRVVMETGDLTLSKWQEASKHGYASSE